MEAIHQWDQDKVQWMAFVNKRAQKMWTYMHREQRRFERGTDSGSVTRVYPGESADLGACWVDTWPAGPGQHGSEKRTEATQTLIHILESAPAHILRLVKSLRVGTLRGTEESKAIAMVARWATKQDTL